VLPNHKITLPQAGLFALKCAKKEHFNGKKNNITHFVFSLIGNNKNISLFCTKKHFGELRTTKKINNGR